MHYLKIVGHSLLVKSSVYLARYNPGWHDRKMEKVFNSKIESNIQEFIKSMKIGCPAKLDKLLVFYKDLTKQSKKLFTDEARYLFSESKKEIGLEKGMIIKSSKCLNPTI